MFTISLKVKEKKYFISIATATHAYFNILWRFLKDMSILSKYLTYYLGYVNTIAVIAILHLPLIKHSYKI